MDIYKKNWSDQRPNNMVDENNFSPCTFFIYILDTNATGLFSSDSQKTLLS